MRVCKINQKQREQTPSLRAKRSNPAVSISKMLDSFVAAFAAQSLLLAMTATLVFALLCTILPHAAHAELRITIDKANPQPIPIAITTFGETGATTSKIGRDISEVIGADLERSGLFKPLKSSSFIQINVNNQVKPRFADWRVIGANALVTGTVTRQPGGKIKSDFRLWDVVAEQQLTGFSYTTEQSNWRRVSHIIADEIYKRVTGEEGYFDTQIVYISETGPAHKRVKRLAIMDYDGYNHKFLTNGANLVLTPRFSAVLRQITYLAYINNKPRVYLFDIDTGRQKLLGQFPGMTFAPRFSPDNKKVIMSQAYKGNTDIFTIDLATMQKNQLTTSLGIDTAPSYSPNGKQITFESDRGGTQQLYIMNEDGSSQRRITFGEGRYGNPVWSPRGDLIAFTKMLGGQFYIGVIRPDGSGERLLANAFHVEGPTWSPNGRVIMYFSERPSSTGSHEKTAKIYSIDLTGGNLRIVNTPLDGSDPAWSPLISQ